MTYFRLSVPSSSSGLQYLRISRVSMLPLALPVPVAAPVVPPDVRRRRQRPLRRLRHYEPKMNKVMNEWMNFKEKSLPRSSGGQNATIIS
jgi:hypothetical protein